MVQWTIFPRSGQIERCFATKANLMSLPSRSRLRPFLGCHVPPPLMDNTTLLVIILLIIIFGGGGYYGRGRWW